MNTNDIKELQTKKIGYIPVSKDLVSSAGDRRRFLYYAKQLNLNWEVAQSNKVYDIVYITTAANITKWINYKNKYPKTILIFDFNNAYFYIENKIYNFLRGLSRWITGRESVFYLNYNTVYYKMFNTADIIVCPTKAAKEHISEFNSHVHIAFDYFKEDISIKKTKYDASNSPFIIVWEGMGVTANNILTISSVLEKFKDRILLRIITDKEVTYAKYYKKDITKLFKKLKLNYEFIEWKKDTFCENIVTADIAIIPIDRSNKLAFNKPENKLILLWQLGMPVITTDTPEYKNAFSSLNYDLTCKELSDWERNLNFALSGNLKYDKHMEEVEKYVNINRSQKAFITAWNNIFSDALSANSPAEKIK